MTRTRKNGVPVNYVGRIRRVTDDFHKELLVLALSYVRQEEFLFFIEIKRETILGQLSALYKKYEKKYAQELALYRYDSKFSTTDCRFPSPIEKQIGLDASKCELHQLDAVLVTVIDATDLANKIKIYLFLIIVRKPDLQNYLSQLFESLGTWKMDDRETLESQLFREISLIANPHLREVFSVLLTELVPRLERRFLPYEGCASFGSRQCLLCDEHFANANPELEPFTLPNFENTTDPRHFYWSIFRKIFYGSLLDFLKRVQSD